MTIETEIGAVMDTIPGCIAGGYVDMETGMLLGTVTTGDTSGATLETLAIAVANLFQGHGVRAFEALLNESGVQDGDNTGFGEIAVFSNDHLYIFLRTADYPEHVVCYICRDSANVGLALTKSHLSLGSITAAV